MNGKVHYWIVCDAVAYIKNNGTPLQKRALQSFELAYGQRKSIEEIPASQSAMERLAGFESWHTDKFGDLSLRVPGLLWKTKRNLTGLFGHTFTAFNHFINPYPDVTKQWSTGSGYSYNSSSMQGPCKTAEFSSFTGQWNCHAVQEARRQGFARGRNKTGPPAKSV